MRSWPMIASASTTASFDAYGGRFSAETILFSEKNHDHHIELEKYLSLVDWTGSDLPPGRGGTTPGRLSPILDRLVQSGECWMETGRHFGRWFKRAAGGRDSLAAAA